MNKDIITSIRILPSDKGTFSKESEFRYFIENTMVTRGGEYYFPNLMMNCPKYTFVLFQYDGMIRAVGILLDLGKKNVVDERGEKYAGYYRFDIDTLVYLDGILDLLRRTNSVLLDDSAKIIAEIENTDIVGTEKDALVKVRVNQGVFRDQLLKKYTKCCLCGVGDASFLIASHIKPWAESESNEKLDLENGFLLCPNHDKLFDGGWISFDDDGKIMVSVALQHNDKIFMNIQEDMKITISEKNRQYLQFHRKKIFKS